MKKISPVFGFLVLLILSSCIVYHPQTIDIPLISEKNDLRIDAGVSLIPSAYATVSYGLSDKIAIQGFGSIGADERYYFQGALGYYKATETKRILEIYSGAAIGYGDAYKSSTGGGLFGSYKIGFAQINYGKLDCKFANTDYGLGIKTGLLHSNLIDSDYYYPADGMDSNYIDNSLFLEPQFFARLGGEQLKFSIKLGNCWIYKLTHKDKSFPFSYINLGLGLNYQF